MSPFYEFRCDSKHFRNVLKDAGARPFACHLTYWTAPIYVDKIRLSLLDDFKTTEQFILVGTKNLDAYGALLLSEAHLPKTLLGITIEGFRGNEFRNKQVSPELFAEFPEGQVGDVVHRRETDDAGFVWEQRSHLYF